MNPVTLLLSMSGRLPRRHFWLGLLYIVVLSLVVFIILFALGLGHQSHFTTTMTTDGGNPTTGQGTTFTLSPLGNLVETLVTTYPWLTLALKRRRDRGNSGLDVVIYQIVLVVFHLLAAIDVGNMVSGLLGIALSIGGIYLVVVLGILRGRPGPNEYGPDPLVG